MALARILLKCPTRESHPFKALANVWLQFCGFLPTFKPLPCSFFKPMANFLPKECNMDRIYDNTKDRCSTTYGHMLMQMKLKYPETFISRKKGVQIANLQEDDTTCVNIASAESTISYSHGIWVWWSFGQQVIEQYSHCLLAWLEGPPYTGEHFESSMCRSYMLRV